MANGEGSIAATVASLTQMYPFLKRTLDKLGFLLDQPIIRQPYYLATSAAGGQVIGAGLNNVPLLNSDFSHSLTWPFEVHRIRPSLDVSHTVRDARVNILDLTYNTYWMKNPVMLDGLIDANTGFWEFGFPWLIRPEGGGQQFFIDNLDTVNPIQLSFTLHGFLLIPADRNAR